jgi:1-phosphofructokinase
VNERSGPLSAAPLSFGDGPRVAVFAPTPLLTITVEEGDDRPDIHLHAGGQGYWVARLAAALGADVVLCAPLGGEPGRVLRGLIESERLTLRSSAASRANGIYIHDRRSGKRVEVASALARPLRRHELDELYGIVLTTALRCDIAMLTGPFPADAVEAALYRRLTHDLRDNGKLVIADLAGRALTETLSAGVDLLKLSREEIVHEGFAPGGTREQLIGGMRRLHDAGATLVVLTRGAASALALIGVSDRTSLLEVRSPHFEELDNTGAGDSMFAALGVALAGGLPLPAALRLASAAGALNVTRHGLGSGTRTEIERLAELITVSECEK